MRPPPPRETFGSGPDFVDGLEGRLSWPGGAATDSPEDRNHDGSDKPQYSFRDRRTSAFLCDRESVALLRGLRKRAPSERGDRIPEMESMSEVKSFMIRNRDSMFFGALVLCGLYVTSLQSFLLFHSLVETFSVLIAWGIFTVAWNSRHLQENGCLLYLGIGYLFVGIVNVLHMLAYKGMGVFAAGGANLSTQLWIVARCLESFSLLAAPFFLGRKSSAPLIFAGYGAITALALASVFAWGVFPVCCVEGAGVTRFKTVSEYLICLMMLGSFFSFYQKRRELDRGVHLLLSASIILTIAAELAFSSYVNVYGPANLIGHFLRALSCYLIYKAFIETGIIEPFNLLFRNLKRSEKNLFSLLEELPAFVYLQSPDYQIRYSNRRFREIFGEADGRACYNVLMGAEKPCDACTTTEVFKTGVPRRKEWGFADGATYQLFIYPFADEDGAPLVLKLGIDITPRKQAEEELRRARSILEERVRERTTELTKINRSLQVEINERKRVEASLLRSEEELRLLSSRLLTAQEEERKRVAMELHDSIGGSLTGIKFCVEHAISQIEQASKGAVSDRLRAVVPMVQSTVEELRRIHTGIWPSVLQDLGIVTAVDYLCRQIQNAHPDIVITKRIDVREGEVADQLKIVIYRLIQEGLNNALKHSGANELRLSLERRAGALELLIEDNGAGFDVESAFTCAKSRRGVGLSSMRERARLSHGVCEIRSRKGEGTSIRAVWAQSGNTGGPLNEDDSGAAG